MKSSNHQVREAAEFLRKKLNDPVIDCALILGSGLSGVAASAKVQAVIPYSGIPHLKFPHVSGHKGELVLGKLSGKTILIFSGRTHFYEGYTMSEIVFPVRVAAELGTGKLILSAATGGMKKEFKPGTIAVLKDYINFMGENPLRGPHDPASGDRFPDMTQCFDKNLQTLALKVAEAKKIAARPAVYFAVSGPTYESLSEVKAFAKLGGDIVGMSVVPEAIAAHQMGVKVLGLCYVSNYSAGINKNPLSHLEVLKEGQETAPRLSRLIEGVVAGI